jgi:hypothetical protein
MRNLYLIFFFYFFSSPVTTSAAIFSIEPNGESEPQLCSLYKIAIRGEIVEGDAEKFRAKLISFTSKFQEDECNNGRLTLLLGSGGGDLSESLKLGKLIRKYNLYTRVPYNWACESSCVFLLAAGVQRDVFGVVGIHRPYLVELKGAISVSDVAKMRKEINQQIRIYLDEMDVSATLLDKMLSTPPDQMRYLDHAELAELRLSIDDANFEEKMIAEKAAMYRLTSSEYRARNSEAKLICEKYAPRQIACDKKRCLKMGVTAIDCEKQVCLSYAPWLQGECQKSVLLGISRSEFKRRKKIAEQKCSPNLTERSYEICQMKYFLSEK